jgi:hypothetical protein
MSSATLRIAVEKLASMAFAESATPVQDWKGFGQRAIDKLPPELQRVVYLSKDAAFERAFAMALARRLQANSKGRTLN